MPGVTPSHPKILWVVLGALLPPTVAAVATTCRPTADLYAVELAVPNDNRVPAGRWRDGVVEIRLAVRLASWRPDADVDTAVTVLALAEAGGPPRVPAPLIRVSEGTEVRLVIENQLPDSTTSGLPLRRQRRTGTDPLAHDGVVLYGLRAGTVAEDTLHVPRGAVREVRFRATRRGTFLYWGAASASPITARTGRDAQLTGALVVDAADDVVNDSERIFVLTEIDILPDSAGPPPLEDIFEMAINGLSWPHTERLHYAVGETVHWRFLNGTTVNHPMHLHGFHFRVTARGDSRGETRYPTDAAPLAVTENLQPGATFRLHWEPKRPGAWLVHCHIKAHVTPFPERTSEARAHDAHDVVRHPLEAMAGLVLGVEVTAPPDAAARQPSRASRLRLFAQESQVGATASAGTAPPPMRRGYVLERDAPPRPDSVPVTGPLLLLERDRATRITIVNRLAEPTTIHWHGLELESVYDGVSGWSRTGDRVAPLVAPGDSFQVQITPPRAGTFIYHTHMDETDQLPTGLFGPLLVLDSGQVFDPEVDHVFVLGESVDDGERRITLNGRAQPDTLRLAARRTHRLRFINIQPDANAQFTLTQNGDTLLWRPLAKDGADLPPALRATRGAHIGLGVGETADFEWTPEEAGLIVLELRIPFLTSTEELRLRQVVLAR